MNPAAEQRESERREQALVLSFEEHLRSEGHDVSRLKIVPAGEHRPLFCDLFDRTANTLVEAKGSVTREAVRMGIGQLLDYRRFVEGNPRLALLLPEQPRADLIHLMQDVGIEPIWPHKDGFTSAGQRRGSAVRTPH